jgi:sulfite exporter TauE/SafE
VTALTAGLLLGLASSLHCVAMCGPIVLLAAGGQLRASLTYHAGRTLTYVAFGLAAGSAGHVAAQAGWRNGLAIAAGAALLLAAAAAAAGRALPGTTRWLQPLTSQLGAAMRRLDRAGWRGRLAAGSLNALVPCGLLYAALTASAGLGSSLAGATLMLGFGTATVPLLVFAGSVPAGTGLRRHLRFASPAAAALVGVLLIGRGLAIGPLTHTAHDTAAPAAHMHAPASDVRSAAARP